MAKDPNFKSCAPRRLQYIYSAMKTRCYNPNHMYYYKYKDIGMCKEWYENSKAFYVWALSNGYESKLSIDRIDNNKGYYPENCRWVDIPTQCQNKTNNVVTLEIARQIQAEPWRANLDELCKKYGLAKGTLKNIKYKKTWR